MSTPPFGSPPPENQPGQAWSPPPAGPGDPFGQAPWGDSAASSWPPAGPPAPTARPRRTLAWLLVAGLAAVVLLGGGAGLAYWLIAGRDTPRAAAERFLEAAQAHDEAAAREVMCAKARTEIERPVPPADTSIVSWKFITDTELSDTTASVVMEVVIREDGEQETERLRFELVQEDDRWLVCDID